MMRQNCTFIQLRLSFALMFCRKGNRTARVKFSVRPQAINQQRWQRHRVIREGLPSRSPSLESITVMSVFRGWHNYNMKRSHWERGTASQMTSYAPRSDLHRLIAVCLPMWPTVVHYMEGTGWCLTDQSPVWLLRCGPALVSAWHIWWKRWLCVEDDFRNLSVLNGGAIVVACRVAEGETGLCAGGRGLVRHFSHSFSPIMRIWTLQERGGWLHYTLWHHV